ncbi:enoyl-CoA hydratase/isomerase family protein [Halomonas campisalis]|uniref:Enoyl-CoA hydratase/isomerase family protein n=1 Tax=Billgrantia campisalis TaxID=74661 RepID=A0ABS9P425_9GAMM|nr:enoyl-CoA hydratase/isomerase family protein [Halomonas campisalis]MCG6656532.1 enoyl-CoA hydratase/isomerase family protein [Halomonas campisalis]MDR5861718.1 enoyl-CoA hydratase/isomerase family protein [Halomonas campisalis]
MSQASPETLIIARHGPVMEIRFNRPQRLNAVVETLYTELLAALADAEADVDVRAVILTGEGRAFCVGADMKEHGGAKRSLFQRRQYLQLGNDVCEAILRLDKPVIAAVNGYALGAGAEMAVACDFIVMADEAQIGFPETSIGTCVGGGVSKLLPQLVGLNKARELLFTGRRIDGGEAARIGLATSSWPVESLMPEAHRLAEELGKQAPISIAMLKRLVNQGSDTGLESQLQQELDAVFTCSTTADWQEGVDAFAEKRPPRFRGE